MPKPINVFFLFNDRLALNRHLAWWWAMRSTIEHAYLEERHSLSTWRHAYYIYRGTPTICKPSTANTPHSWFTKKQQHFNSTQLHSNNVTLQNFPIIGTFARCWQHSVRYIVQFIAFRHARLKWLQNTKNSWTEINIAALKLSFIFNLLFMIVWEIERKTIVSN